jgi:hypothetical protein
MALRRDQTDATRGRDTAPDGEQLSTERRLTFRLLVGMAGPTATRLIGVDELGESGDGRRPFRVSVARRAL